MIRQVLLFCLFAVHSLFAMHRADKGVALGVETFRYLDQERNRPIVVELWYPAERKGTLSEKDPLWIRPEEFRGAPAIKDSNKRPLILISHGHKGERKDLCWLADQLVRRAGYVVAAVEHYGDTRQACDFQQALRFWDRALDFTFILNLWEKETPLPDQIDLQKVAFAGYSMGGMTGLGLAGARATQVKEAYATLLEQFKELPSITLEGFDLSESERSFFEPRISGAFLICPATFPYAEESLKQVSMPVGLVVAVEDEVLPFKDHASRLIRSLSPKKLKVLKEGISHYAFLSRPTELGKKLWEKKNVFLTDRTTVHQEVSDFAIEFFREILRPDKIPATN